MSAVGSHTRCAFVALEQVIGRAKEEGTLRLTSRRSRCSFGAWVNRLAPPAATAPRPADHLPQPRTQAGAPFDERAEARLRGSRRHACQGRAGQPRLRAPHGPWSAGDRPSQAAGTPADPLHRGSQLWAIRGRAVFDAVIEDDAIVVVRVRSIVTASSRSARRNLPRSRPLIFFGTALGHWANGRGSGMPHGFLPRQAVAAALRRRTLGGVMKLSGPV